MYCELFKINRVPLLDLKTFYYYYYYLYFLFFAQLTDDACTDSFTLNQVARMHCYLDLIYQTWQPAPKPPPVPMAPQVVDQHHNSITLEWFPPISGHFYDR